MLSDSPRYLEAMVKSKWSRGGGDIKIYALKTLICLIEELIRLIKNIDRKLDLILDRLGELSEKNAHKFR